ncbi:gephyrin-like molybdotransferase Glp [Miniphocaeibacter halophilus]|uniref:Molybdopterin molybdenumtransferase MoeA n=1 Tax=Miniphocaeibacter halophilus TaxID=2931922 RepID=A0AC61N2N5_9FIRM|nr:gephyrin-like molybdotransferase Glp [Miniphocaeibacter halophilus]QQK09049.1 molybdopterin molybdenumtransferase MoeA [Miniphocaeibacter halophilus]
MKLLKVDEVERVQEKIWNIVNNWNLNTEIINISEASGRILAHDIITKEDIPGFTRSTVDGYAVFSKDTAAAGDSIPVFLKNIGVIEMGQASDLEIISGQCVEISTGGMLPKGANGVVMVEYTENFGEDGVAVSSSISEGENVVYPNEDVSKGQLILRKGSKLLPQSIGVLSALGITEIKVYKPLSLTIISTGDEIVSPEKPLELGKVRDINSLALKALAEKNGYSVIDIFVLKDDEDLLRETVKKAMEKSDLVAVSGGSSQGKKDITAKVLDNISSPGVFTHGMAIKPGKPTIVAYDENSKTLLIGLPGHPVSAMLVFDILFNKMIKKLMEVEEELEIPAKVTTNLASSPGKTTCWPVKLLKDKGGYLAKPIFGKSGLITSLLGADGYFSVNRNHEGLEKGDEVWVKLF